MELRRRVVLVALAAAPLLFASHRALADVGWQQYADKMVASGKLSGAAITDHQGRLFAAKNLPGSPEEFATLAAAFKDAATIRAEGIKMVKVKYMALGCDDVSIKGKKTGGGILAAKTGQLIVVGIYGEGVQPGDALVQVETMADYLRNMRY